MFFLCVKESNWERAPTKLSQNSLCSMEPIRELAVRCSMEPIRELAVRRSMEPIRELALRRYSLRSYLHLANKFARPLVQHA